jgi:hypothetical protein
MTDKTHVPFADAINRFGELIYGHLWGYLPFREKNLSKKDIKSILKLPPPKGGTSILERAEKDFWRNKDPEAFVLNNLQSSNSQVNSIDGSDEVRFGPIKYIIRQIDLDEVNRIEAIAIAVLYIMEACVVPMYYRKTKGGKVARKWHKIDPAKLLVYDIAGKLDFETGAISLEPVGMVSDLSFEKDAIGQFIAKGEAEYQRASYRRGGAQEIYDWQTIDRLLYSELVQPLDTRTDTDIGIEATERLFDDGVETPEESRMRKRIRFIRNNAF